MLPKSSSPLIGWFDTAVVCRSDQCVMLTSRSLVERCEACCLRFSYRRGLPLSAECMGNQMAPPPVERPKQTARTLPAESCGSQVGAWPALHCPQVSPIICHSCPDESLRTKVWATDPIIALTT